MIKLLTVIGTLITLSVVYAHAQHSDGTNSNPDEFLFFRGASGSDYYYLTSSVREKGNFKYVWIREDASGNANVEHRKAMIRNKVHCENETMANVAWTTYLPNGGLEDSWSGDYAAQEPITPDTLGEAIWKMLCQ